MTHDVIRLNLSSMYFIIKHIDWNHLSEPSHQGPSLFRGWKRALYSLRLEYRTHPLTTNG